MPTVISSCGTLGGCSVLCTVLVSLSVDWQRVDTTHTDDPPVKSERGTQHVNITTYFKREIYSAYIFKCEENNSLISLVLIHM